jgi:glycosyltransferase involved in cell wall biosynthesis
MRIAIIGTRGVPARYGGFETCAEELGKRLVQNQHTVDVFCRSQYYEKRPRQYLGMRLIYLPSLSLKSLETLSHGFLSLLDASTKSYDIVLVFNPANGPLLLLPRLIGQKTVLNVDGLEWERKKWSRLGKIYHKLGARMATKLADVLVADSLEMQKYYLKKFNKETEFIPYGADLQSSQDKSILSRYGLDPGEYFLQVTRFEPENNPLLPIQALDHLRTDKKLVLVGGVKYPSPYSKRIFSTQDKRIRFAGFIYDQTVLRELLANCLAYIHGNEAGGTNPALLQAMASGCFVIARDVVFNREVLQDAGLYFNQDAKDLAAKMQWAIENADRLSPFKQKAKAIIASKYNWDDVARSYIRVFYRLRSHS